jgi:triacylglycerol esterase/lipase EstA (alpha/beta hydrolase family)
LLLILTVLIYGIFYTSELVSGNDYNLKLKSTQYADILDESGYFTIKGTNNVKGSVDGNWDKFNSPYIVTDSIFIDNTYTLNIEPGVEIKSSTGYNRLNITGNIKSLANATSQTSFRRYNNRN